MRLGLIFLGAGIVFGCTLPNSTPVAVVDTSKIVLERVNSYSVTVQGLPGAITGARTTSVTLTIGRAPMPSPQAYALLHFGDHMPITSTYALVDAQGAFTKTTLGDAEHIVKPLDELGVTPQNGTAQAGYSVFTPVP